MIDLSKYENVWLTSDSHFFHTNIIKYCNRPFSDVTEMNTILATNWNSSVGKNDFVFFVGDFGFGSGERLRKVLNYLNGDKMLVMGNHDQQTKRLRDCFKQVVFKYSFRYEGRNIYLQHRPFQQFHPTQYDIYIHGHTHGNNGQLFDNQIDVSCDCWNYSPAHINRVISLWDTRCYP